MFYFCHLKKLVRPETFGPYCVYEEMNTLVKLIPVSWRYPIQISTDEHYDPHCSWRSLLRLLSLGPTIHRHYSTSHYTPYSQRIWQNLMDILPNRPQMFPCISFYARYGLDDKAFESREGKQVIFTSPNPPGWLWGFTFLPFNLLATDFFF